MSLADEMMGAGSSSSSRNDCVTPPVSSHFGKSSTGPASDDGLVGIPEFLPDDFCTRSVNFYVYSSLTIAKRFLLAGLGKGLKEDKDVRISQKILALSFLSAAVQKHPNIIKEAVHGYDGDQFLSDVYGFLDHDDDGFVIAVLNFFVNAEKACFSKGKTPHTHSGRTLAMIAKALQNRNPMRLKGALQVFANSVSMLVVDDQMLSTSCDLAISTIDIDYFLVKIARAEFLSKIEWSKASSHSRVFYQPKCLEVLLEQVFDSDARVVKATCEVFPLVVKNAEFDAHKSTLFYSSLPDWFADSGLAHLPMVPGLHPSQYSFRGSVAEISPEHSLSCIIQSLYCLSIDNLSQKQSGFIHLLSVLIQHYPPCLFVHAWLPITGSAKMASNMIGLLLEISESSCSTLTELTALFRLISALFAGISEHSLLHTPSKKELLKQAQTSGIGDVQTVESILVLCLRVLNLYYTIIAEEKTKHSSALTASIFSRPNIIDPLTPKLGDLGVLKSSTNDSPGSSTPPTSSRTTNLSFLVGTSVKMTRNTSYLQSNSLKHLEPGLKGAYRNFLDTINADSHQRFVEPLEAVMNALSVTLFDVSVEHSAILIHQFVKTIFTKNAISIDSSLVNGLKTSTGVRSANDDLLEVYLQKSVNEFTVFSAFINKSEYMENYLLKNAGWMTGNTLNKMSVAGEAQLTEISNSLQMFEHFITRLIHIYPLTNSAGVRKAILEVLTSLSLNDVRYEMIDQNKKFYNRVINQLKQLQREDVPLLQPIFTFLVVLSRINYLSFIDVESLMCDIFLKLDENNVLHVLDAVHVSFLCKEFDFMFSHCPKASSHLWILLLNMARSSKDEEYWSEVSFDFFVLFTKWCIKKNSINNSLEGCVTQPVHTQLAVLLSYCSPSVFRPIDQFYNCLEGILRLPSLPTSPLSSTNSSTESLETNAFRKVLPFLFHLLCQMEENVVLLRLNTLNKDSVDFLGRSMADLVLECTKNLRNISANRDVVQEELVFFILIVLHALRSNKSPQLIQCFKTHLFSKLDADSGIVHRSNLQLIVELGLNYVKAHAYWFAMLLSLNYHNQDSVDLYFSDNYTSHTKTMVTLLIVHKICDQSDARFASILANASEEFCVRLLKLDNCFDEIVFKKFASQLPTDVWNGILVKQYHFFHTNHLDALLPAFLKYLQTSEKSPYPNLLSKLNQSNNWKEKLSLLNQWIFNKDKANYSDETSLPNIRASN
uniref:Huntingtin n=1 Tax=Ditylenchus dipsaci TaxID=166011 RepID=A0A915DR43_9BILA